MGGGGSEEELPWYELDDIAEDTDVILFFDCGDETGGGGKVDMISIVVLRTTTLL